MLPAGQNAHSTRKNDSYLTYLHEGEVKWGLHGKRGSGERAVRRERGQGREGMRGVRGAWGSKGGGVRGRNSRILLYYENA